MGAFMTDENKEKVKAAAKILAKEVLRALVTFGSVVVAMLLGA